MTQPDSLAAPAQPVWAFIGVGANLDGPREHVRRALDELATLPRSRLVTASSLYRSPPMGPPDQPDYINAVAQLETTLAPMDLLSELQRIENLHGRVRKDERWGPRTLDLDILLYAERIIDQPRLQVPHRGLHERAFVLYPLREIAPELQVPGRGALEMLARACPREGLERIQDPS
mgnify:CR=1 FL=1